MFGEAILPESATVRLLYVSPLALLQLLPGVGLALVRMVQVRISAAVGSHSKMKEQVLSAQRPSEDENHLWDYHEMACST
jgi:hypothetical protein